MLFKLLDYLFIFLFHCLHKKFAMITSSFAIITAFSSSFLRHVFVYLFYLCPSL